MSLVWFQFYFPFYFLLCFLDSEASWCEQFSSFKEEMIKIFDRSVYGHEASRQIVTLRQGRRSAANYAIEFRTLAPLPTQILEGLSGEIKEEIISCDLPTRLDQLVELAIRLDNRFFCAATATTPCPNYGQSHQLSLLPQRPQQFLNPWSWWVFASPLLNLSATSRGASACIVAHRGISLQGVQ